MQPHPRSILFVQSLGSARLALLGVFTLVWFAVCPIASAAGAQPDNGLLIRQGDMCLDVNATQAQMDGARVRLWRCDGRATQVWRIEGQRINQRDTDYCLEVHAPDIGGDGARVQIAACRNSDVQVWRTDRGQLVNRGDRRCLTVYGPDANRNGAHVENYGCEDAERTSERARHANGQRWSIEPILQRPPPRALTHDVEAGPLWNDADAARKCPQVCTPERWNGAWRTTIQGRMSVCGCERAPPEFLDERDDEHRDGGRDNRAARPMTDSAFSALLEMMSREAFSDAKLRILEVAAERNLFLMAQVRRVIDTLPFASDRTRVVDILAPRVLDPENTYTLLDAFSFDSEKAHVRDAFNDPAH